MDIGTVISTFSLINSPLILEYKNWKYEPPEVKVEKTGLFTKETKTIRNGELSFESDEVDFTLQDLINQSPEKRVPPPVALSVVAQVWQAMNYLRSISPYFTVFCLDPATIALTRVPGPTPDVYNVRLTRYIPLIFFPAINNTGPLFCSPALLAHIRRQSSYTYSMFNVPKGDLHALAILVTYLFTGRFPFKSQYINTPNAAAGNVIEIPPFPDPTAERFVRAVLLHNADWQYTYTDEFLKQARRATFDELPSRPSDFDLIGKIGTGVSATVYQAIQRTRRGERIVAVKEMEIEDDILDFVQNEVDIMTLCNHPNVITMYDSFTHKGSIFDPAKTARYANIILEYCDGGTLQSYFEHTFPTEPCPEYLLKRVLDGVLKGLWYLHSEHHIVHRDLKPENILLQVDPNNVSNPIIKIADFGLSKIVDNHVMMTSYVGTPVLMAPEVFLHLSYTYKCDFWSLGGMIYFLRTHEYPLTANKTRFMALMKSRTTPAYNPALWGRIPQLQDLVNHLIVFDTRSRYDWKDIHNHPFVQSFIGPKSSFDYHKL